MIKKQQGCGNLGIWEANLRKINLVKKFIILPIFVSFCLIAGPSSQSSATLQEAVRPQKPLQHEVSVTLKLIQVIVTDKKGNPVTDLRKDEFILYDNGEQKTLTEFEKHVLSLPSAKAPAEEKLAPTPIASTPRLLNRKLFFLFDFAYTDPEGVRLAREAALRFIDTSLLPTDEVGVISFSGKRDLQIHEFQSMDHLKIRKAVESLGIQKMMGVLMDPKGMGRQEQVESGGVVIVAASGSEARFVARNFIWALTTFAQALRYLPGQKQIILISSGIPGPFINSAESKNSDLRNAYTQLGKELTTSNIAVYTISTEPLWPPRPESPTLQEIASATGGKYLGHAANSAEHLEKIQTLTGTYYVLGYSIRETWDGKYHKIKVNVSRPGCEVRAQAGYSDPKPFSEYSDLEKQIHLVDLALAENPLSQAPVRFMMQALACSAESPNNLGFVAKIPLDKIGKVAGTKVEAVSLIFNGADDIVDLRRTESNFTVFKRDKAFHFSLLSVPPGSYKCRVVLRNLETGRAAVAGATAVVPERKPKEILLYPPLFLAPEKGAFYIEENAAKGPAGKGGSDLLAKAFLFDPAQYAPYLETTLKGGTETWVSVRCAVPKGLAGDIRLSASFLDAQTGEEIPVPLTVVAKNDSGGVKTYFVRLEIPAVEPDTYRFSLLAEGPSGMSSRLVRSFVIN
jgi:VWFA-related protein